MLFKKRVLSKLLSGVLSLNLIFQQLVWVGLAFSAVPALAQETVEPITFDKNSNSFTFPINAGETADYLLAYLTAAGQTEVVKGQSQPIYAGTCSTDNNYVDHQVLYGILKTQVVNQTQVQQVRFIIDQAQA